MRVLKSSSTVFDNSALIFVGTHRIQRVPATEKKGRRHTSYVIVHKVNREESGVTQVDKSDVREDFYRSSGAGGQHRNKTDSAVRLKHLPTGIIVTASEERSQYQNRTVAWKRLEEKLSSQAIDTYSINDVQWDWCDWRDEVVLPDGRKKSMSRVLRKGV